MRPMSAVFHLLAILVKVVLPLLMRIWRTRFSNVFIASSLTRRNACEGHGGRVLTTDDQSRLPV